jgi:putative transposase
MLKREGLRSQTGYRLCIGIRGGKPAVVAPNHLQRQFIVAEPNRSCVDDVTYIRTHGLAVPGSGGRSVLASGGRLVNG